MTCRLEILKTGSSKLYPFLESLSLISVFYSFCPPCCFFPAKTPYTNKSSRISGLDTQVQRFVSLSPIQLCLCLFSARSVTDVMTSLKWLTAKISPICLDLMLLERKKSHLREFPCGSPCPRVLRQELLHNYVFLHSLPCSENLVNLTREFYLQSIIQNKYVQTCYSLFIN